MVVKIEECLNLQAVLFDFDGTLGDTQQNHYIAFLNTFKKLGLPIEVINNFTWELYNQLFAPYNDADGFKMLMEYYSGLHFNIDRACDIVSNEYMLLLENSSDVIYPGVHSLVNGLRDCEIPMAIATGSVHNEVHTILKSSNLHPHIGVIISTASGEIPGKPHHASFTEAANKLGVDISCCVCVEDTAKGALAALSAGAKVICVLHSVDRDAFSELIVEYNKRILIVEHISHLTPDHIMGFFEN